MYTGPTCLGITPESTNEEIRAAAFAFLHTIGYMHFATVAVDGVTPNCRALEIHDLDGEGNLYVGASLGKHFYDEVEKTPYVSAVAVDTVSVRVNAWLERTRDEALFARYWELNPGTKSLYRKDLSNFQIWKLVRGEGEIFHVYRADKIARARFSFGGAHIRPWSYMVEAGCTACGACVEACMTDTITLGSVAEIHHYGCNECGICFNTCPVGAIVKTEIV